MEGFGGAPRFLAYPRAITVQSGSDAVLSCRITGDPQPSILWEKDKAPVEPSSRFHVEAKGNLYSLLVSHTTPQDSGLYVCKAKNCVGETYAAATLKVEVGEPQEEEGCPGTKPPAFLVAPSSTRACCGEDVMFTCRVSGQPCPVLEWEKDGRRLPDIFESSHFAVGQEPEDWHFLKLFGVRPPDRGVYICRARSGSQEALAAAVLLVEPCVPLGGLPNGSSADGPEPLAERQQWWQQHVAGRQARAESWVPNGTVLARVPKAKAFAVSVGKHAKFRCYVTGKPKPEIIWQKDGEALAPGRRHLIYEDREGYFTLKVLYCKPQDQGLYVCTASNTAGHTLSAVQLQVKGRRVPERGWGSLALPLALVFHLAGRPLCITCQTLGHLLLVCSGSPAQRCRLKAGDAELLQGNVSPFVPLSHCRGGISGGLLVSSHEWGGGNWALVTNSPGSAKWFWQAALQGSTPRVCTGASPFAQSHPASWRQPTAAAAWHLVPPAAPPCSPLLRGLLWHADMHAPASPQTHCRDAGGIAGSPQPVPWLPSCSGRCASEAESILRRKKRRGAKKGQGPGTL